MILETLDRIIENRTKNKDGNLYIYLPLSLFDIAGKELEKNNISLCEMYGATWFVYPNIDGVDLDNYKPEFSVYFMRTPIDEFIETFTQINNQTLTSKNKEVIETPINKSIDARSEAFKIWNQPETKNKVVDGDLVNAAEKIISELIKGFQ